MATIPATLPSTTVDNGTANTVDLSAIFTSGTTKFSTSGKLPTGLSFKPSNIGATSIQGTTSNAGTFTLTLNGRDDAGDMTDQSDTLQLIVNVPGALNIPAVTDGPTIVPVGEPVAILLRPFMSGATSSYVDFTGIPAALALKPFAFGGDHLLGTFTEPGTYDLTANGDYGASIAFTITAAAPVTVIPVPAAEATEDGYMLPDVPGVIWTVDGVERVPGTYSVEPVEVETEVTILPTADTGYAFDTEPVPLVLVFLPAPGPDPEPEPDPEPVPVPGPFDPTPAPDEPDEPTEAMWARLMDDDPQAHYVATRLAERIIRHTGGDAASLDPEAVLTARDHAGTVLEYVRGYVRGRGFVGYIPHRSLQAVIVSAGARLFVNPEQMTYYSTGDYSERPATMTGWTHAELGVLRRFRRTYR